MSFPYTPDEQGEKVESLKTQSEYLRLLRLRHLQWMNLADDSQVRGTHQNIAEHIEAILDHYQHLLEDKAAVKEG